MRTRPKTRPATPIRYIERINRAIDHVMQGLGEPLRLVDVARAADLSPFHFHRVFQALAGETLLDFVKRQRLDRALAMMAARPRETLTRIALACGFSSSSDFSRSFKQRFAVPPSAFDVRAWRDAHRSELMASMSAPSLIVRPAADPNADTFRVVLRELPARSVAYIRVRNPYRGGGVVAAAERLVRWAERHGCADGQWLGYQWENPELVPLEQCCYHVAVEAGRFMAEGEVGRFRFPPMTVAQVEVRGGIELELRALQWLYGVWLPASRYVPDDHPCFEAWIGRPFAHGMEHFELHAQLPVRRG